MKRHHLDVRHLLDGVADPLTANPALLHPPVRHVIGAEHGRVIDDHPTEVQVLDGLLPAPRGSTGWLYTSVATAALSSSSTSVPEIMVMVSQGHTLAQMVHPVHTSQSTTTT